eukprot:g871.t1
MYDRSYDISAHEDAGAPSFAQTQAARRRMVFSGKFFVKSRHDSATPVAVFDKATGAAMPWRDFTANFPWHAQKGFQNLEFWVGAGGHTPAAGRLVKDWDTYHYYHYLTDPPSDSMSHGNTNRFYSQDLRFRVKLQAYQAPLESLCGIPQGDESFGDAGMPPGGGGSNETDNTCFAMLPGGGGGRAADTSSLGGSGASSTSGPASCAGFPADGVEDPNGTSFCRKSRLPKFGRAHAVRLNDFSGLVVEVLSVEPTTAEQIEVEKGLGTMMDNVGVSKQSFLRSLARGQTTSLIANRGNLVAPNSHLHGTPLAAASGLPLNAAVVGHPDQHEVFAKGFWWHQQAVRANLYSLSHVWNAVAPTGAYHAGLEVRSVAFGSRSTVEQLDQAPADLRQMGVYTNAQEAELHGLVGAGAPGSWFAPPPLADDCFTLPNRRRQAMKYQARDVADAMVCSDGFVDYLSHLARRMTSQSRRIWFPATSSSDVRLLQNVQEGEQPAFRVWGRSRTSSDAFSADANANQNYDQHYARLIYGGTAYYKPDAVVDRGATSSSQYISTGGGPLRVGPAPSFAPESQQMTFFDLQHQFFAEFDLAGAPDIQRSEPKIAHKQYANTFANSVFLGYAFLSKQELGKAIATTNAQFPEYELMSRNCCHFVAALGKALGVEKALPYKYYVLGEVGSNLGLAHTVVNNGRVNRRTNRATNSGCV